MSTVIRNLYSSLALYILALGWTNAQVQLQKQAVSYVVHSPGEVGTGTAFAISILLSIEPGWYIYAPTGANATQGMTETRVTFVLPNGLRRAGKIEIPEPIFKDGCEVLQGDIAIHQKLRAEKAGEYTVTGRITYQSCNTNLCLPPITEEFTTTLYVR